MIALPLQSTVFHNALKRILEEKTIYSADQSYGRDMVLNTHSGYFTFFRSSLSRLAVVAVHLNDIPLIRLFVVARLSGFHRNVAGRLLRLRTKSKTAPTVTLERRPAFLSGSGFAHNSYSLLRKFQFLYYHKIISGTMIETSGSKT